MSDAALPTYNARSGRIFLLVFKIRYDSTFAPEGLRRGVRLLVKNELADRYWGSHSITRSSKCVPSYMLGWQGTTLH